MAAAVVAAALVGAAVRCLPSSADGMRSSSVVVECRSCIEISGGGKTWLWAAQTAGDSVLVSPAATRRQAEQVTLSGGCWMNRWPGVPSCRGRIVTVLPADGIALAASGNAAKASADGADGTAAGAAVRMGDREVRSLLAKTRTGVADSLARARAEDSELQYYLRVHGVQDEGYQQIAALATTLKKRVAALEATAHAIDTMLHNAAWQLSARRVATYAAHYRAAGKAAAVACVPVATARHCRMALLQTADGTTPSGVKAQYLLPWNTTNRRLLAVGYGALGIADMASAAAQPCIVEGRRSKNRHNYPRVLVADGCALFTPRGLFAGIVEGQTIDGRGDVSLLMMKGGWR